MVTDGGIAGVWTGLISRSGVNWLKPLSHSFLEGAGVMQIAPGVRFGCNVPGILLDLLLRLEMLCAFLSSMWCLDCDG